MFSAPIPGQSLTSEPKNSAWENPPQFVEPEDDEAFEKDLSYSVREKKAQVILDEYKKTGDVVDISSVEESVPDEPMEKEEPEPMGLMSRRTV